MFERMEARRLEIPEVMLITPARHRDARGFFSETYNQSTICQVWD